MTTCQECEKFKVRIKKWNHTYGMIDPLPYIDDIIEPHKHLIFEGCRQDGTGRSVLSFQCLGCDQWWNVSAWGLFGTLDLQPQSSIHHAFG